MALVREIRMKKMERLLNNAIKSNHDDLVKAYKQQAQKILNDAEKLYLKLEAGGQLTVAELYRQDRYYQFLASINRNLQALGESEVKIMRRGMRELYRQSALTVSPFAIVDNDKVQEVIEQVWCADGKKWSDRIWLHKSELQLTLSEELMNCIIRGDSHEKLVKELMHRFNVSRSQSERISRTELNRIQNRGAIAGYLAAGYESYRYLAAHDERTSDVCSALDGQIFRFEDAKEGINFPPMHPNCRSTIIGYKGE